MKRSSEPISTGPDTPTGPVKLNLYYRLPVVALCSLLFWQSCFPLMKPPVEFPLWDKALHVVVYGILGFLAARCLNREKTGRSLSRRGLIFAAFLFTALFGLSDEIHQSFVPGRHASAGDMAADALGGFLGAYAFFLLKNRVPWIR